MSRFVQNDLSGNINSEIIEIHQFFMDWFTGSISNTEEVFFRFFKVLTPNFELITPSGNIFHYTDVIEMIKSSYGSRSLPNSQFKIEIKNINVRFAFQSILGATYEEWQYSDDSKTARISTVIFQKNNNTSNQLSWVHVHETWLEKI